MGNKVTNIRPSYPLGEKPNFCVPEKFNNDHRFLLGRLERKLLVAICMNPSAANEDYSDRTINRIISTSKILGYDGWLVANVYPERATNASNLDDFNSDLAEKNVQLIIEFLKKHEIREVWGAWGNLRHPALIQGRDLLLIALKEHDIKVYSFAPLTKLGQPVHPLNRRSKQVFSDSNKRYLSFYPINLIEYIN